MLNPTQRFDVLHLSSAHPWTDVRIHQRQAASAAAAGLRTGLIAVENADRGAERAWGTDPATGVSVRCIPRRSRLRRMTVSSAQVVRLALRTPSEVVQLHDPEMLWAVPLLRASGRKVVYDAHEDLPDQVRGKEYLRGVLRVLAIAVAHVLVRLAGASDAVVAATPAVASRFPRAKTTVVRNLPRVTDADLVASLDRPARVVYLGSHSRDRGLEALCDIARRPDRSWQLVTAGPVEPSSHRQAFDELVRAELIDHRGVLPPSDARALLLESRVGLLPLRPTPAYRTSIPTKLFEYMAAGLAVVATDVPFWRELLDGIDCVTWVPADDPAAITSAIERYVREPERARGHARAGRTAVIERLRWEVDESVLLGVYRSLFGAMPFDLVGPVEAD